jgi:hypothetical protein
MPKYILEFNDQSQKPMEIDGPGSIVTVVRGLNAGQFAHIGKFDGDPVALNTSAIFSIREVKAPPEPPTLGEELEDEDAEE